MLALAQAVPPGDELGIPWTGEPGVTETVADIMSHDRNLPLQSYFKPAQGDEGRLLPNRKNLPGNPEIPARQYRRPLFH